MDKLQLTGRNLGQVFNSRSLWKWLHAYCFAGASWYTQELKWRQEINYSFPFTSNLHAQSHIDIEIGLEQAPTVFLFNFFSSFEHVKSLVIMGPNYTKNSSVKCDFLIINYE
jgi:hypothetical protein